MERLGDARFSPNPNGSIRAGKDRATASDCHELAAVPSDVIKPLVDTPLAVCPANAVAACQYRSSHCFSLRLPIPPNDHQPVAVCRQGRQMLEGP